MVECFLRIWETGISFMQESLLFLVSVPVSEVIGVKEGRVEIQPQKKVEDTDLDFTRKFWKWIFFTWGSNSTLD